jgi:hypothetical protein
MNNYFEYRVSLGMGGYGPRVWILCDSPNRIPEPGEAAAHEVCAKLCVWGSESVIGNWWGYEFMPRDLSGILAILNDMGGDLNFALPGE